MSCHGIKTGIVSLSLTNLTPTPMSQGPGMLTNRK